MTPIYLVLSATLVASTLTVETRTASAGGWRCMDEPGESECQDSLINEIEDEVDNQWRSTVAMAMPPLPYSCSRTGGPNPVASDQANTNVTAAADMPLRGNFAWAFTFTTELRSFLVGRDSAAVDLSGSLAVSGQNAIPTGWDSMNANLLFAESNAEVMAPEGPTGVAELGGVAHATLTGDFWTRNRTVRFTWTQDLREGDYACVVGSPVLARGTGRNRVVIDVPVGQLLVQSTLAEVVREEFRRAVRLAVTGSL
jgi:hypothetical protein